MFHCSFELNNQPLSNFFVVNKSFPAFSGLGEHANRRSMTCAKGVGPLPLGRYYIVDRQSGGMLGSVRDLMSGKRDWFALYAADSAIDDYTFCDQVKRGNFRLHPKSGLGVSEGCITIDSAADFDQIRAILRSIQGASIPRSVLKAYGMVTVK
ncbi:DUF2778 domain-containing protein [Noviherbaspirillum malthae]|uniref:DUF2778 domain-containing protein n=1 Tax=Noviherbaspirillum malthae TaxID=1260987 RepID=UPI00188DE985|nr:DUF2778 domain-containing protein [Noviherbaspirillum malthae]